MTDQQAKPIPVAEFEGEYVRAMEGKLPAIVLDMPEGYARGTHLKLEVEVRVRNVRYEEIRTGPDKGDLTRQHVFALEEVKLIGAFSPDELDPGVGGSASVEAVKAEDEDDLVDHAFEAFDGATGETCTAMVMRDGGGDQCGLPPEAHPSDLPATGTDVGF